jgi:hypothetical protein
MVFVSVLTLRDGKLQLPWKAKNNANLRVTEGLIQLTDKSTTLLNTVLKQKSTACFH